VYPVSPELHNIVNLWHGIPLKRIGYASLDMQAVLDALGVEHALCRAVISSSEVDTMAMASAFYPLDYNKVWCTGLPRNDFVLCPFERLPTDLREESARLDDMLEGRRLVLFVPTFRLAQRDAYYQFAADEIAWLHAWLRDNGAVLGVREHMADTSRVYYRQLRGPDVVDLGDRSFPDVEVLYRHAAALVTDYSSSFIDFLLTGRPVVSFAYDYESYADTQRGFFYDMAHVFPGPICRDFDALRQALIGVFEQAGPAAKAEYEWKRRLFFKYFDNANTWRVVKKVKGLYGGADFSSDAARR
jgi:CDP-glycerol glycerophosphotransferase (TagB/SpsB family)